MAQLQLVARGRNMTMVLMMRDFLSSPSLALMIKEVSDEALNFLPLLQDAQTKMGPFFEIARYVAPEGLEPLNASLFPHLYTAAYYTAMSHGAMRDNYK